MMPAQVVAVPATYHHERRHMTTAAARSCPGNVLMEEKLERIRAGAPVRTMDLFAGCGGITLGLHTAGFQVVAAVEFDRAAAGSWADNFAKTIPGAELDRFAQPKDITLLDPGDVLDRCGVQADSEAEAIDVLVGGPPCQAFARIGRAKLRDVLEHPEAFRVDPRAKLYQRYIAFVRATRPLAILMENVPDILNHGGSNIPEQVCDVLEELGYHCQYTILNTAAYGVPQHRQRMFLVAIHEVVDGTFAFPAPTHAVNPPAGYKGSRTHALGDLLDRFEGAADAGGTRLVPPPAAGEGLPPAWSARDAIGDLPRIMALDLHQRDRWPRRGAFSDYTLRAAAKNDYQQLMRNWPGFRAPDTITDHIVRWLPRDFRLFNRMRPGMEYPELHALAETLFRSEVLPNLRRLKAQIPTEGTKAWKAFKARWVPPYAPDKFSNKWWMLRPGEPSRTLMAHLGKDSYSHIHYDRKQARTISVREAARLQSFPDGFRFGSGGADAISMNAALKQIGNSVPPLMSYALGRSIRKALGLRDRHPLAPYFRGAR